MVQNNKLSGDYIAGFVDGEGCFALKFRRDVRKDRSGNPEYFYWDIEFDIVLKADDKEILEKIGSALNCGTITIDKRGMARYSVSNTNDLFNKVVPFFERYRLHAKKRYDFELWREAVNIFHRNQNGGGIRKSQKNSWRKEDVKMLIKLQEKMKAYKGGNRHNWKWMHKSSSY